MDSNDCTKWTGRKFLFVAVNHNVPGQIPKDIKRIRIEGTVTGVVIDDKTEATFVEISTRNIYISNRVFPIVNQVITMEKNKKPYLYFDAKRTTGHECFSGEFLLVES